MASVSLAANLRSHQQRLPSPPAPSTVVRRMSNLHGQKSAPRFNPADLRHPDYIHGKASDLIRATSPEAGAVQPAAGTELPRRMSDQNLLPFGLIGNDFATSSPRRRGRGSRASFGVTSPRKSQHSRANSVTTTMDLKDTTDGAASAVQSLPPYMQSPPPHMRSPAPYVKSPPPAPTAQKPVTHDKAYRAWLNQRPGDFAKKIPGFEKLTGLSQKE
jgi:hypothetical protein